MLSMSVFSSYDGPSSIQHLSDAIMHYDVHVSNEFSGRTWQPPLVSLGAW